MRKKVKNLAKRINRYIVGKVIGDIGGRVNDFIEQILILNKSVKKAYVTDIGIFSKKPKNHRIDFIVQASSTKLPFTKETMNTIILSMVLHHLNDQDQKNLIRNIVSYLKEGGLIILIEDSYPQSEEIRGYNENIKHFLKFSSEEKNKILSFYDWFGNVIMRNRDSMSLTFNFKTMEGWKKLFEKHGIMQISSEFVKENLSKPDIFPPKAVMVFQKK
jgi:SAM-dependent methyltransferase